MKTLLVGICGGSGSGKTTLSKKVVEGLGKDNASLLSMDSFYKYQPNTTYEQRCLTNYDHPNAFESNLLLECLSQLKEGKDVKIPVYDFTIHNRSDAPWETVKNKRVIIMDGILLFAFPEILNVLDIKVFVDTPADVRVLRRLARDVNERARSVDSVIDQYLSVVKPMHETYIEPNKRFADIIVPEGGHNKVACQMIMDAILKRIEREDA